jgi:mannose-6-phosphate isomerase
MPRITNLPRTYELDQDAMNKLEEERRNANPKPFHADFITPDGWVHRPWGRFKVIVDESFTKVKRLIVYPGRRLSLQSHSKRTENWTVVAGAPTVTLEEVFEESQLITYQLRVGSHVEIKNHRWHRLANFTNENAEIIEVQTGDYFGEDDITRYEDDFGRL